MRWAGRNDCRFRNAEHAAQGLFLDACVANSTSVNGSRRGQEYTFRESVRRGSGKFIGMEAFAVAVPTPYFAVTAADGSYEIERSRRELYGKVCTQGEEGRNVVTVNGRTKRIETGSRREHDACAEKNQ